jgi:ABC-2 type transport system permease protein
MASDVATGTRPATAGAVVGDRRATIAVFLTTAKRAVRSAILWGLLFGGLIANEALTYEQGFPDLESRRQFAEAFGANGGLAAVAGEGRQLGTIEGFVAWRVFGLLIIVGAVWGLLIASRLLRGEEDAGRWELLLSGRTARRHATVQGMAGLAAGLAVLWVLTAVPTVAAGAGEKVGFSVSASLFYATAATASAPMFLALGALASQLSPTRRQANSLAAAVFGLALLIRMAADTVDGLDWMRWASPLGWVENLHPLTGSQPLALVPIILLTLVSAGAAIILAGRRDVGAGALGRERTPEENLRLLGGPASLVVRLERWVALGWVLGLGALAAVFGVVAGAAAEANLASDVEQAVGRLGADQGGATAWIGYEFMYLAALAAFAVGGQVSAMRSEEADGYLDHLLARRVGRSRWLAGRLAFAATLAVLCGLATAAGGWLGLAATGAGGEIGIAAMLKTGFNVMVPALFVVGIGALLYGLVPRIAVPALYTFILWSFVVVIIGSSVTTNRWLLDTALLTHLGPVPATGLHWAAIGWMAGIALAASGIGFLVFRRRDLAGA